MKFTRDNFLRISGSGSGSGNTYKMDNTLIDDLTIFNRALTQEEAKYLYNSQFDVPRPKINISNELPSISWDSSENIQLFRNNELIYTGNYSRFIDYDFLSMFKPNAVLNLTHTKTYNNGNVSLDISFKEPELNNFLEADYNIKTHSNISSVSSNFTYSKEFKFRPNVKGYSYIIDLDGTSIPDDIIDIENTNINIKNIPYSKELYLNIKTVDTCGNVSETSHIKIDLSDIPVELVLENLNPDISNKDVKIKATALYDGNLDYILLPNGDKVYSNEAVFLAPQDGEYIFTAVEKKR